jgi:hypothetical protein
MKSESKHGLIKIKDINFAIQSKVCVTEGQEVIDDVVSINDEKYMSQNHLNESAITEKFSENWIMEHV